MNKFLRYPVYIISKGRHDCCKTAKFLRRDNVPFHIVIEPQEEDLYLKEFNKDQLYILPFSNLGLGSIPARNWVWEHAKSLGAERHWILDDNILEIYRRYKAQRVRCDAGVAFRACEEFIDRYENIALAGMNYKMFAPDRIKLKIFRTNVHVYSCLCIRNDLPFRWRGRYNEDTDLCLQVLAAGWCTVLFNAFLIEKVATMTMKGGNMESLYKADGRLKMARSLQRQWPYAIETKRRYNRPQHYVRKIWRGFDTPLKLKSGINLSELEANEYDLELIKLRDVKPGKSSPFGVGK
jgi:hypothetical protein